MARAPWFGQGGGTYIAKSAVYILDNQYLTTAIELGLVGVAAFAFFLLWPAIAALVARKRTADPEMRDLAAALAGAALAAAVGSATFDSLSFPMFVNVQALVLGLIGAVWLVVDRERKAAQDLVGLSYGQTVAKHGEQAQASRYRCRRTGWRELMDLISIFRAVWRHKLVTIPVILFTCLGAFYVVAIKAPVYQASASFALVYPPAPPTAAQVAADPKLAEINTSNPLLAYSDPSAVSQIVISLVSTPSSQQALAEGWGRHSVSDRAECRLVRDHRHHRRGNVRRRRRCSAQTW